MAIHYAGPPQIDFNCDMGEGFGAYTLGHDARSSATSRRPTSPAGSTPATRAGCARRSRWPRRTAWASARTPGSRTCGGSAGETCAATPAEIRDDLVYQIGALTAFTREKRLQHVKPHGALYNMAVDREDIARRDRPRRSLAVDQRLILVVLAGSRWEAAARRARRCAWRARCSPTARSAPTARWCREAEAGRGHPRSRPPSSSAASRW